MKFNNKKMSELMIIKCVTNEQMAKETGLHRNTINNIRVGKSQPTGKTLKTICDYLGVKPEEMLISLFKEPNTPFIPHK